MLCERTLHERLSFFSGLSTFVRLFSRTLTVSNCVTPHRPFLLFYNSVLFTGSGLKNNRRLLLDRVLDNNSQNANIQAVHSYSMTGVF